MRKGLVSKIAADMASLPKSRQEAKDRGFTYFYTGRPCKYGHLSTRHAVGGWCVECHNIMQVKSYDSKRIKPNSRPALLKIDDALADKALARELKEVWDE